MDWWIGIGDVDNNDDDRGENEVQGLLREGFVDSLEEALPIRSAPFLGFLLLFLSRLDLFLFLFWVQNQEFVFRFCNNAFSYKRYFPRITRVFVDMCIYTDDFIFFACSV